MSGGTLSLNFYEYIMAVVIKKHDGSLSVVRVS